VKCKYFLLSVPVGLNAKRYFLYHQTAKRSLVTQLVSRMGIYVNGIRHPVCVRKSRNRNYLNQNHKTVVLMVQDISSSVFKALTIISGYSDPVRNVTYFSTKL